METRPGEIRDLDHVRDLSDFCHGWQEYRKIIDEFQTDDDEAAKVTRWLVLLADKVCNDQLGDHPSRWF